jgi:hypothetical protein
LATAAGEPGGVSVGRFGDDGGHGWFWSL